MRDSLRTKEHWDNMFNYLNEEIEWSKEIILKVIQEKGDDFKGVKIGYLRLNALYMMLLNSLYSSGAPIEEIKKLFSVIVEILNKHWTKESGYIDLIWIVSIGVMLNSPMEIMKEIKRIVDSNKYGDYLLDFFFHSVDTSWEKQHTSFNAPTPYRFLQSVIEAPTKEESAKLLKVYLDEKWYKGHNDEFWYNSHKDKDSFYDGYWSYESGAIAKILKLDDDGWDKIKYYPYDMVHC